jgi:hypothetical protein
MIVSFVIFLIYSLLAGLTQLIALLPDVTMPSFIASAMSTANSVLSLGFQILPAFTYSLLLTWGVYLTIEGGIFVYQGVRWIYKKIPGIN